MSKGGNDMKKQSRKMNNRAAVIPGEWLYVAKEEVNVRRIAEVLPKELDVEVWEEAGVLEIAISGKQSMDVEHVRIHPKDELTRAFVREHGCAEVFLVTFPSEIYEQVQGIMQKLLEELGGLFCGDTEDFSPILQA